MSILIKKDCALFDIRYVAMLTLNRKRIATYLKNTAGAGNLSTEIFIWKNRLILLPSYSISTLKGKKTKQKKKQGILKLQR